MTAHNRGISDWFDGIPIQVGTGIDTSGTGNVGSGEKFMLNTAEATELRDRLSEILRELRNLRQDADSLTQVKPPADEPVSNEFNRSLAGKGHGLGVFDYAVGHIDLEIAYLKEFRRRLEKALGSTVETDEENKRVLPSDASNGDGGVYG